MNNKHNSGLITGGAGYIGSTCLAALSPYSRYFFRCSQGLYSPLDKIKDEIFDVDLSDENNKK